MNKTKLADRIEKILRERPAGMTPEEAKADIEAKLVALGTESRIGAVRFAGTNTLDQLLVQFDVGPESWASKWPDWAFAYAREALLYQRKLWVISFGEPWGSNLFAVCVMDAAA